MKGDTVRITGPQFERTDGLEVTFFPKTAEAFNLLKEYPDDVLRAMGLEQWDEGHWLFPKEWYDNIPEGHMVLDINEDMEPFVRGKTDNDIRFGCLAYGFRK